MSEGIRRIAAERRRQIKSEKWTAHHDNGHAGGELAMAAAAYAWPPSRFVSGVNKIRRGRLWPFYDGWKPTPDDRLRELEKAGALIAAEIDRLLRASLRASS